MNKGNAAVKPTAKKEEATKMKVETAVTVVTVEQRKRNANKLIALSDRQEALNQSKQKLDSFVIATEGESQSLRLECDREVFKTNNPRALEAVKVALQKVTEEELKRTEAELLAFEI